MSPVIKSYVISTIHALITVISVLNYFIRYEVNFNAMNRIVGGGVFGTGDETMVYNVCYSSGYFIYDFLLMLKDKNIRSRSSLIHHILILVTFLSGLYTGVCHPCHFYLLGEELSTIPLNLKTIYRKNANLHGIFSMLFVISFVLIRLIYGSIICGYALSFAPEFFRLSWNADDLSSFIFGVIQASFCLLTRVLNFYWTFLIFRKIFSLRN